MDVSDSTTLMPAASSASRRPLTSVGSQRELPDLVEILEVLGTVVHPHQHHLVLAGVLGDLEDALADELPRHRPRLGQRSAVLGEKRPDFGTGAVPVVREGLDHQRHPGRSVALVDDLFIVDAFELAGPPLDRSLDRVERYRVVSRLLEHRAQRRIGLRVTSTLAGGNLDLFDQLGEQLSPLGVSGTLLVLDRCPFGVTRHGSPL